MADGSSWPRGFEFPPPPPRKFGLKSKLIAALHGAGLMAIFAGSAVVSYKTAESLERYRIERMLAAPYENESLSDIAQKLRCPPLPMAYPRPWCEE